MDTLSSRPVLNFPDYNFSFRETAGKTEIFDPVRKKYVALTKEEWVRQNLVQYLLQEKNVPMGLIAVEKGLKVILMEKRFDVLVFGRDGLPRLLAECKAPGIELKQDVFDQVARYNIAYRVNYLLITNGLQHFCCKVDFQKETYEFLKEVPVFDSLV